MFGRKTVMDAALYILCFLSCGKDICQRLSLFVAEVVALLEVFLQRMKQQHGNR